LEQFIFAKKKKFGPRKIAHELFNKGIDEGLIEKNLSEMKQEENFLIKEICISNWLLGPWNNG